VYAVDLIIGEYVHRLPMKSDESAVLAELTDAVLAGGGIVDLPTHRQESSVAVLISPGVPVFVERNFVPDDLDDDASTADDPDFADWVDA
jgi:hypothetical protein